MQLSLPEHRLQELKARSIMHTSWIFIPAIISLSLLASEVHRCHRHAEGGFLWRFLLPSADLESALWEMLWPFPIYTCRKMMSWEHRDYCSGCALLHLYPSSPLSTSSSPFPLSPHSPPPLLNFKWKWHLPLLPLLLQISDAQESFKSNSI